MGHRVTSMLVQVRKADGSYAHVYEGGFLPDDADPDHVALLLEGEMVEEADEPTPDDEDVKPKRSRKADG